MTWRWVMEKGDMHLGTATTLHHALVFGYVAAESLFLVCIPRPVFLERVQRQLHELRQDMAFLFPLDALDEFV